jgi:hypothetical protein
LEVPLLRGPFFLYIPNLTYLKDFLVFKVGHSFFSFFMSDTRAFGFKQNLYGGEGGAVREFELTI